MGGKQRQREPVDAEGHAGSVNHFAGLSAKAPFRAEMIFVVVEAHAGGRLLAGADRDQKLELGSLLKLIDRHQLAAATKERIVGNLDIVLDTERLGDFRRARNPAFAEVEDMLR